MIFKRILGGKSRHERAADAYKTEVIAVNSRAVDFEKLSDNELKQKALQYQGKEFAEIRTHVADVYAAAREAARRTIKMRHFDVQITGGLVLLDKAIAEMKTGEGKTLAATLPLTLHALTGQGAHLVTVNDYLASRDADWMRPVYEFFGFSVGTVISGQSPDTKRLEYAADITYGTNNEFGFDYLRDNMAVNVEQIVQRGLNYAIVDEVDSILIDEARTPLIISAPDAESTKLYQRFSQLIPQLIEDTHYNIDEKRRAATLTDQGVTKAEQMLGIDNLYTEGGIRLVHHLEQALRAQTLFSKDKDYVVKNGQVIIVDEFTGRLMPGRRFSEGLHQALEAKERVAVQQESRTLATITFQNFFRLYEHLAGMTGTAVTSAEEFEKVYNLDVVVVPTNQIMVRHDKPDRIYATEEAKYRACVAEIKSRHNEHQPVLVGTIAIEKSEKLSAMLTHEGVPHEVLNAKHHEREAEIIAKAGHNSAVTISTNMAGRGTDIKLGEGVAELGGLFVLGTERHEARRIDNQLRGRAGRQGDKGATQFFVSLEDDVMRIFGGDRIKNIMQRLKVPEDEPIENKLLSRALEGAQERVEGHYFDARKQVLAYDDVLNRQRNAIYTLRRGILLHSKWQEADQEEESLHQHVKNLLALQTTSIVSAHTGEGQPEKWNLTEISEVIGTLTGEKPSEILSDLQNSRAEALPDGPLKAQENVKKVVTNRLLTRLSEREQEFGLDALLSLEKAAAIRSLDIHWMDHLDTMDYLRTGIGLRGYGQRDPLVEYQKEGYQLFQQLLFTIKTSIVETIFKAEAIQQRREEGQAQHASVIAPHRIGNDINDTFVNTNDPTKASRHAKPLANQFKNIGRNDPCWCGSGLKYKRCGLINSPQHKPR